VPAVDKMTVDKLVRRFGTFLYQLSYPLLRTIIIMNYS